MIGKNIEWTSEKVSSLWNFYSENEPYKSLYFSKVYGKKILELSKLPLNLELDILDFGCGPGYIFDTLLKAKSKWNYHAIDFSEDSIKRASVNIGKPRFKQASHISKLPTAFADNSFDVVLLIEVIEHLTADECHGTLDEVYRLLKPGGILLITTPNNENLSNSMKFCPECHIIFHEWQHIKSWTTKTLNETALSKKLVPKKIITTNIQESRLKNTLRWALGKLGVKKHEVKNIIATFQKA